MRSPLDLGSAPQKKKKKKNAFQIVPWDGYRNIDSKQHGNKGSLLLCHSTMKATVWLCLGGRRLKKSDIENPSLLVVD